MSIKVENTDNKNELKLTFTVDAETFEQGMKKVYAKTANYFNVPGFRKGKAPMSKVEKMYGSQIFYEDTFNEIVPEIFEKELKDNNIEAVSKPEIDIIQIEKGKELIFTAIIQTKPEVKLGKYKGIELKKIEYNVTDADIDHEIGHMAEKGSRLVSVENEPVKEHDIAVIDFEGFVDGVAFEGGKAENHELEIGSKTFIPGFEDQVIGMKIDEEKEINVKFPDEYFSKDLAGKYAMFKVKLHEIKRKELPTIDDEFAKDVSEFDTLKELKADTRAHLEEENSRRAKYEMEEDAIEEVTHSAKIDIPAKMLDAEIDGYIHDMNHRLEHQGMTLDMYMQMMNTDLASVRDEFRGKAEHNIMTRLVLEAIFEAEKIEITDEDINKKLADVAKEYGRDAEEFVKKANDQVKEFAKEELKYDLAVKFIMDNAK